jgi:hypothetical protein
MQSSSTALPDLQVLPTLSLIPHEDCDPRRGERLGRRLLEEGLLKHPPVVAAIPERDSYVVLDGANRSQAFAQLGIPHIVAQVVSYADPGVALDSWNHVVSGMAPAEFEAALLAMPAARLQACSLDAARLALAADDALAYIINDDGVRKVVPVEGGRNMRLLIDLVNTYRGRADIIRASNDNWEIQKPYYPGINALVVFPRLRPADILHAACNDYKVPSGITRHIIPARALNINIPLPVLMTDWPIERKREWLEHWYMEKHNSNAIRYYAESTFSFNE